MTFWNDPIAFLSELFRNLIAYLNLPPGIETLINYLVGGVVVASFGLALVIFLIWVERKVAARIQDRLGPNRAGPYGLLQTFADVLKLIGKEDITPERADKPAYNIAPILALTSVILIWAVVPFSVTWFGADLNVGVLYIAAVGSFGILSVLLAGWSSNNKYALLGAFRAVSQLISYEVPLFLALLVPVILARSMGLNDIVKAQSAWFVLLAPLPALIFFVSSLAEIGRAPFDLLEAESEIVAGFNVEYTGMKFGMFFAAEFLHAFTIAVLTALLFFGGWRGPGVEQFRLLGLVYLMLKSAVLYFVVMLVRNTLPRVRIDHMLAFNWKFLTPLTLVLVMVTAVLDKAVSQYGLEPYRILLFLGANLLVLLVTLQVMRVISRRLQSQLQTFEPRPVAVPPPAPPSEA